MEGCGGNVFLIIPLSWDLSLCGLIHSYEIPFQLSPYKALGYMIPRGESMFSASDTPTVVSFGNPLLS